MAKQNTRIYDFNRKYAPYLFNMLQTKLGEKASDSCYTISMGALRKVMNLTGNYPYQSDILHDAVKPALKNIKKHTGIEYQCSTRRTLGDVMFDFTFVQEQPDQATQSNAVTACVQRVLEFNEPEYISSPTSYKPDNSVEPKNSSKKIAVTVSVVSNKLENKVVNRTNIFDTDICLNELLKWAEDVGVESPTISDLSFSEV